MRDDRNVAGNLLPARLSELVGKQVHGSVDVIEHVGHDCSADPVGETREFASTDGSMSIQWCEACGWHSVGNRVVS